MATPSTTIDRSISSPALVSMIPTSTEAKSSPRNQGISNGDSHFSQVNNNNSDTMFSEKVRSRSTSTDGKPLNFNPSTSTNPVTSSSSKSKLSSDPEPRSSFIDTRDVTIPMVISTIFQRFLVRMPHTFIAMAGVFVPLYYGLNKESLAISATTFVGVGGTVYCFVRAFFLETIPVWMLAKTNDTKIWRRLMNITYTGFITAMFTSAVWKLPDLTTAQGFAFLTASFVAPYPLLARFYPDIDKLPSNFDRKYNC